MLLSRKCEALKPASHSSETAAAAGREREQRAGFLVS